MLGSMFCKLAKTLPDTLLILAGSYFKLASTRVEDRLRGRTGKEGNNSKSTVECYGLFIICSSK